MAAMVSASMPLWELPFGGDEPVAYGLGEGVEVAGVVGGEVFEAELVLHRGEAWVRAGPVWIFSRPAGRLRRRSRKTSAPDCPPPMTVMCSAVREAFAVGEVVRGVDDGDAGGVDEGSEGLGDVGCGADAEDDVAGVGAAEGLGFSSLSSWVKSTSNRVRSGFQRTASTWWPKWSPGGERRRP